MKKKEHHIRLGSKENYTFQMRVAIPKKGNNPFPTCPYIFLATHGKDSDGKITIASQITTPEDVDHKIDELIQNLERIRKEAKEVLEIWGGGGVIYYEDAKNKPSWLQKGE